jgi:excisionase family DNA binding protein
VSLLTSLTADAHAELAAFVDRRIAEALAQRDRQPDKRWLTTAEAAAYLGTTPRALHQRIRRGRIPAGAIRHHGRSLLLDRLALDRALDQGE